MVVAIYESCEYASLPSFLTFNLLICAAVVCDSLQFLCHRIFNLVV